MANTKETVCGEDEREYNYKFVVTGTFIGDKGETINQERILQVARLTDSSEAWEWLYNADFELYNEDEEEEHIKKERIK